MKNSIKIRAISLAILISIFCSYSVYAGENDIFNQERQTDVVNSSLLNGELNQETASTNIVTDMLWAIPKPAPLQDLSVNLVKPGLREIPDSVTKPASETNAITPYIVGGVPASRGEYPEYGSLWVDGLDGYIYFICGSTLIFSNKVLTAAHCTINYPAYRLYVIPNYYSHDDSISQNQVYQANNSKRSLYQYSSSFVQLSFWFGWQQHFNIFNAGCFGQFSKNRF